jgi:saccharopine dehydrogenase (NAD+, L-lysine-forming)
VISAFFAQFKGCNSIRLCDTNFEAIKRYADWLKSDRLSVFRADAKHTEQVARLARGVDVVVNAVLPKFNLNVLKAAFKAGANYLDLAFGPPYDNLKRELECSGLLREVGLVAVTGAGKAPGLTNVLAAKAADRLDEVKNIFVRLYGSIESAEPVMTWSPRTLLEDCALKPVVLRDGELVEVDPFSGEEPYVFPVQRIGTKRVWNHLHEEVFMFQRSFSSKGLKNSDLKMGGIDQIKCLYELGLLSTERVVVGGRHVVPLEVVASLLPKPPLQSELQAKIKSGLVRGSTGCEVVVVEGEKSGETLKHVLWVSDPDIKSVVHSYPMATDDSYVVGLSGSIMACFLAEKRIRNPGVYTPEELPRTIRTEYLKELAKLRPPIEFQEKVTELEIART